MTQISGNTYPVKDAIKAMGGRWNAEKKCWMVPDELAAKAKALVSGAVSTPTAYHPRKCVVCGGTEKRDTRGYVQAGTKIYRSGECQDCFEERKMGY
jgi:hypothetical protein